ncbi:MAG: penicillin-binding protein [Acidobacteria bacterium]|nr:penicillin-binding protein [Acidobacteriota bacterium]
MHRSRLRWWSFFLAALLVFLPAGEVWVQAAQKKKSSHRRVRYTVPSYADPTVNDLLEGEEIPVREVAVRALGNLNGSVMVVEADSGRILTLVNQKLALSSGFKPCSTIKLAVSLAALEEGLITGDTLLRVSRRQSINLTEALAYSNNPFFEILGKRLGFEKVSSYARLLGFGELAGYLVEDEHPGSFPTRPPAYGGVGRLSSFGEGVKVTPLQLAALMAAFANGGTLHYLQYPRTEKERAGFKPRVKRHLPIQRWLPELRAGMEAAVLYGTARVSAEAEEHLLGKTGTCGEDRAKLGWFASYGELPRGQRVAVIVLLRGGRPLSGSKAAEVAGQVYRGLSQTYLLANRPEDVPPPPPATGN